jgi:hypothetical protein
MFPNPEEGFGAAQETGSTLPAIGQPGQFGLLLLEQGLLAREQRDRNTEREKIARALVIFTDLKMPRERGEVRAERQQQLN